MKTKYIIGLTMLFFAAICFTSCRDLDDPEEFMYGKWKISSIDSCAQLVVFNSDAEINEYQILNNQGSFYFHKDGTCTIRNINRDTLLCGKEFNWSRTNSDSIKFDFNDGYVSESSLTQYSNDKIQFDIYIIKYGFTVWFRVILKR